jgi:hypothetical protein
MKKLISGVHNEMVKAFHPIHPFPVYLFMVIALLSPIICYYLKH